MGEFFLAMTIFHQFYQQMWSIIATVEDITQRLFGPSIALAKASQTRSASFIFMYNKLY